MFLSFCSVGIDLHICFIDGGIASETDITTKWSGALWKQINIIENDLQLSRMAYRPGLVWNLE